MFSREVLKAIETDALDRYPEESCGAVTPEGYLPLENRAADRRHSFDCREACQQLQFDGALLAVVHSHPDGPAGPSSADMAQQLGMDVPWGLVATNGQGCTKPFFWGDGVATPPLRGRTFRHGPSGSDGAGDCYALIRDYYRLERGVELPEFPRDDDWWLARRDNPDLYSQGFPKAGFRMIYADEVQPGDVFLAQIRSPVMNHGGIILGNERILHHLSGRLSGEAHYTSWAKFINRWLRYDPQPAAGAPA
jgi:cell wall-associated NlpC family hydrolase